jgi:hypothetical protein
VFVVPWQAIQQPQQQAAAQPGQPQQPQQPQHLTVKLEKDRLQSAPKFTVQQLTSPQGSAQWMAQVNEFYKVGETGVARPENPTNQPRPDGATQPRLPQKQPE